MYAAADPALAAAAAPAPAVAAACALAAARALAAACDLAPLRIFAAVPVHAAPAAAPQGHLQEKVESDNKPPCKPCI